MFSPSIFNISICYDADLSDFLRERGRGRKLKGGKGGKGGKGKAKRAEKAKEGKG